MSSTNDSDKWPMAAMTTAACINHCKGERQVEFQSLRKVGKMAFNPHEGGWVEYSRRTSKTVTPERGKSR